MKSFRPKDETPEDGQGGAGSGGAGRNGERDFRGETRRNDTHASTSDPEARLYRKGDGKEAKLCFMGHLLMENWDCPDLVDGLRAWVLLRRMVPLNRCQALVRTAVPVKDRRPRSGAPKGASLTDIAGSEHPVSIGSMPTRSPPPLR